MKQACWLILTVLAGFGLARSQEIDVTVNVPALLVLAVIVGLVPGITAYRADVARGLSD